MRKIREFLGWVLGALLILGLLACIAAGVCGDRKGGPHGKFLLQPPR